MQEMIFCLIHEQQIIAVAFARFLNNGSLLGWRATILTRQPIIEKKGDENDHTR
jgi:hypothetical protein